MIKKDARCPLPETWDCAQCGHLRLDHKLNAPGVDRKQRCRVSKCECRDFSPAQAQLSYLLMDPVGYREEIAALRTRPRRPKRTAWRVCGGESQRF